ncbi:uncharacterized protein LOC113016544 [Astatotilapia calliptera]|uniref:uncharacterized protein LOC113016544 n=1 Tax=Astatotilapia calliptera TaxID=8154 RepID=UPI000E427F66|nr:uncharacterized protein LOC113016544 [Astatotilapia calliptera]
MSHIYARANDRVSRAKVCTTEELSAEKEATKKEKKRVRFATLPTLHGSDRCWEHIIPLKRERVQDEQRVSRECGEAGSTDRVGFFRCQQRSSSEQTAPKTECLFVNKSNRGVSVAKGSPAKNLIPPLPPLPVKPQKTQRAPIIKKVRTTEELRAENEAAKKEKKRVRFATLPTLHGSDRCWEHTIPLKRERLQDEQRVSRECGEAGSTDRVGFFRCQQRSSSEQTAPKTECLFVNKSNRGVSVAKGSPAKNLLPPLPPLPVKPQKTQRAPIIKKQYKVLAPYAPSMLEKWDINTNKNLIPPLPPLPVKPQKTQRAPIIKKQYKVLAPYAPSMLEKWDINTNKNLIPPLPPLSHPFLSCQHYNQEVFNSDK